MGDSILNDYKAKGNGGGSSSGSIGTEPPATATSSVPMPNTPAIMLDVGFRTGHRMAINYAYITTIEFDPGKAMTIKGADQALTVTGRNLLPVYLALMAHQLVQLKESPTTIDDGESEFFIKSIGVSI